MITRRIVVLCATLLLAGCAGPPRAMTTSELSAYRIAEVDVVLPAHAKAELSDHSPTQPRVSSAPPESAQSVSDDAPKIKRKLAPLIQPKTNDAVGWAAAQIQSILTGELSDALPGQRPAKLEVNVTNVSFPGLLRSLLQPDWKMTADLTLRDAATGKVLVTYPNMRVSRLVRTGEASLLQLSEDIAARYRRWLLQQ